MKTLNLIVLFVLAFVLFGSVACEWLEGDDSGGSTPTSPSYTPTTPTTRPTTPPTTPRNTRRGATSCVDHGWTETREVGTSTWYFYEFTNTCSYEIEILWTDNDTLRVERYGDGWDDSFAYNHYWDPGQRKQGGQFVDKKSYDNTNPRYVFCAATMGRGDNPCGENDLR